MPSAESRVDTEGRQRQIVKTHVSVILSEDIGLID
jgi:hypothetical protein